MKTKQLFASILCVTSLLFLTPRAAFANSGPKFWYGSDIYGSVTADKNCPITVEHELLTFNIADFPQHNGKNEDYQASVTAEYTFFNPTDQTITARLEFPFGVAPDYATTRNDLSNYEITVNGSAIEKTVRHTIKEKTPTGTPQRFELKKDMARITDGFKEDEFFTPELPVTKYVYEITDYEEETNDRAAFDFPKYLESKVYLDGMNNCVSLSGGKYRLGRIARYSNKPLMVYVFGEQLDSPPEWKFYKDEELSVKSEGTTKFVSAERMTFREFAMSIYPESSSPLEEDWYNAVVDDLNMNFSYYPTENVIDDARVFDTKRANLMRWYEYEITIPPGERIVNTVTAPIYPDIKIDTRPPVYDYTYLLSPAQGWADFGSLDIVVNTPFYLQKDDKAVYYEKFEKTETGYKAAFDGLPEGELRFSLSTDKNPRRINTEAAVLTLFAVGAIGAIAIFVAVIVGVVVLVVALARRRKR